MKDNIEIKIYKIDRRSCPYLKLGEKGKSYD